MTRNPTRPHRSLCPIATTLDIVGDRWSLLIVRDMVNGKSRYAEFLASPERIATNVLAERLERLAGAGVVESRRYQDNPPRHAYRLTEKGEAMLPMLQEMCRWANRFMPETWIPPAGFMARRADSRE
jgi:DNA-binding HxlR family transcriptional regulator